MKEFFWYDIYKVKCYEFLIFGHMIKINIGNKKINDK